LDLYTECLIGIRTDRLWNAYVHWNPDMSFKEFLECDENEKNESGVYIDQVGF
jgi:hypothetical protein